MTAKRMSIFLLLLTSFQWFGLYIPNVMESYSVVSGPIGNFGILLFLTVGFYNCVY